jgi:hypothetical protein
MLLSCVFCVITGVTDIMNKLFSIVLFTKDKSVEIVSSNWICKNENELKCYWPSHNFDNALSSRQHPSKSWKAYSCTVLRRYG